jgi:site-specific DNA-methyltransferase (adenine-specific)
MVGMAKYPDKYFDLAVVDPPYGIMADINQNKLGGKKGFGKNAGSYKKYHTTNWDLNIPSNDYFIELQRVSKNQIIWGGNYFFDLHLSGIIIWNKLGSGNFKQGELAKTNINTFKIFDYSRADAYINDCDIKIHPTQKPVALYSWIYLTYLPKGGKVIDTHLGSGSNRIAADKASNIDFVGFELDADYFEAQEKRWAEYKKQLVLW